MTSFFFIFFYGRVGHIVFGRLRRGYGAPGEKPIHLWQVERVVLNALAKQMRLCRLNLISSNASRAMLAENLPHSAIDFGIVFGRVRRGYSAPGEKPIHLWLSVRR